MIDGCNQKFDKFGQKYVPDEWYSVPLGAIEEMIDRISDRSIVKYFYDEEEQQIKEVKDR